MHTFQGNKKSLLSKQAESLSNRFVIRRCRCSSVSNSEVGLHKHDKRDVEASAKVAQGQVTSVATSVCFVFAFKTRSCCVVRLISTPSQPVPHHLRPCLNLRHAGILGINHNPLFSISRKGEKSAEILYILPHLSTLPESDARWLRHERAESLKEITCSRLTQTHIG